jgi:hypothetical protein
MSGFLSARTYILIKDIGKKPSWDKTGELPVSFLYPLYRGDFPSIGEKLKIKMNRSFFSKSNSAGCRKNLDIDCQDKYIKNIENEGYSPGSSRPGNPFDRL